MLLFAVLFGTLSVLNLYNGVRSLARGNVMVGVIDCTLGALGCGLAWLFTVVAA